MGLTVCFSLGMFLSGLEAAAGFWSTINQIKRMFLCGMEAGARSREKKDAKSSLQYSMNFNVTELVQHTG